MSTHFKDSKFRLVLWLSICGAAVSSCLTLASIFIDTTNNTIITFIGILVMAISLGAASVRISELLFGALLWLYPIWFWNVPLPRRGSLLVPWLVFLGLLIPLLYLGYRRKLPPKSDTAET